MFRILSSKRYWSLIGKIADDQETIKGQAKVISAQQERIKDLTAEMKKKEKTNEYLNELVFSQSKEIGNLRRKVFGESSLGFGGFTMQQSIDFPPTKKMADPLAFDFPGTEKNFDDFWANFTGSKNKES